MRVGMNAGLLNYDPNYRSAGINNYIQGLLANLEVPPGLELHVFSPEPQPKDEFENSHRVWHPSGAALKRPIPRIIWEQTVLPAWCRALRIEALHSPAYVCPLVMSARSFVTVHDLSFELLPTMFNRMNSFYLRTFTRLALKRARLILAVSESAKRDIVRVYDIPGDRIQVIYNGLDRRFRPLSPELIQKFRSRKSLPDRFYYYHGTLEPRKNVGGLIRAYAQLPASLRERLPLIISGALGWHYEPVLELAQSLAGDVRFIGYVDDDELPLWYNAATVFVFPSLYEGFGFPPLEAMACGLPTIVSNRGSLPEIVADGAVIADPLDTELLASEMARLTEEQAMLEMRDRGIKRAAIFDWRQTARRVERVYADFAKDS